MNSILRKSMLSAGAVLLISAGAARADASEPMNVNVPFAFEVNNRTLPAGQYVVRFNDADPAVVMIQNKNQPHTSTVVLTDTAGGQDPAGTKPCLTFSRTGNQYRLSNVFPSGLDGRTIVGNE